MVFRIGRNYRFSAAHRLPRLPVEHKCHHMHGHNYRVEITVRGDLDERGFVMDYAELDKKIAPLIGQLDHKVLNEIESLDNPTAEEIARWFFQRIKKCECVRVWEEEDCWAEYKIN